MKEVAFDLKLQGSTARGELSRSPDFQSLRALRKPKEASRSERNLFQAHFGISKKHARAAGARYFSEAVSTAV